jgi:sulfide:quinone oxidoreductase
MKNIVVLGAGTAGTMAANMLTKEKVLENWTITVVDKNNDHEYQPGFLFVPFGMMPAKRITKSRRKFLPKRAAFVQKMLSL